MGKKYVITFPHAGDYYIPYEFFLRSVGYEVIIPPKSTQETLSLGVKLAPNQACLPFKITLGNIIQGLEKGANVIMMIGGRTGICRLAYYSELYKKVLSDNGYSFEVLNFKLKKEFWDTLKRHFPELKFTRFLMIFRQFWLKLKLVELIREEYLASRPYEAVKEHCKKLREDFLRRLASCNTTRELKDLKREITSGFKNMERLPNRKPLTIGIVGEFYLLIDQFSSLNMEEILSGLDVIVKPSLSFTDFFIGSIKQIRFLDYIIPTHRNRINKLAKPYVNRPIGGHCLQSIGQSLLYAKEGYDGIIHIYPFTCMPEVVARALIPKVSEDYNIPILSLCFDEHTGIAGLQTRLEAFVDMIKRNKHQQNVGNFVAIGERDING